MLVISIQYNIFFFKKFLECLFYTICCYYCKFCDLNFCCSEIVVLNIEYDFFNCADKYIRLQQNPRNASKAPVICRSLFLLTPLCVVLR